MDIVEMFDRISKSLAELEDAIKLLDFTPQLELIDTRIKALTGVVVAKVTGQPENEA